MSRHRKNVSSNEKASGPRDMTLGINVAGLQCLVVGGGRSAAAKLPTLAVAGADVTVLHR